LFVTKNRRKTKGNGMLVSSPSSFQTETKKLKKTPLEEKKRKTHRNKKLIEKKTNVEKRGSLLFFSHFCI